MSDVRKQSSLVCLLALGLSATTTPTAIAEGRAAAPVIFASGNTAPPVAAPASGPIDLRLGAQPVKFAAPPAPAIRNNANPAATAPGLSRPYAGPPYQVKGKWFVPMHEPNYDEVGIASWYGPGFDGEVAASGEIFDQDALTAAHPTLPIPSVVRVTNLETNRSVLLRLNDRGPYIDDRIIDLSRGAADALDVRRNGTAKVRVQYVGPAPSDPNAPLTERMFADQPQTIPAPTPVGLTRPAPASQTDNVWTTPLPPAAGMPSHPAAQAPAPEEQPAPATQPAAGNYAVQVGSFSDLANAHRVLADLNAVSPGYVSGAVVNGSQFYRVMLGPVLDRPQAERLQTQLKQRGTNTLLVEITE